MEEKKDEIKKGDIIIKKMEKKVSFDSNEGMKHQGKSSSGNFFGVFENSDTKKKGILKPPSPKNKDDKMNNIIKDINFPSNPDTKKENLNKNDIIDTNKNLTNNIEKVNNYIHDNNYTELKGKINDLLKEKDYLIKQNKKREKRIIDLIKKYDKIEENEKIDNDNLIVTFKNQENEYIKTINMLQNRIIEKDNEIKMIKEEFKKILND